MISLDDQLACAKRELGLRRKVYPKWVEIGKMAPAKADAEISAMEAIVATLLSLGASDRPASDPNQPALL